MNGNIFIWMLVAFSLSFSGCNKRNIRLLNDIPYSDDWKGTTPPAYEGTEIIRLAWGSVPEQYTSLVHFNDLKNAGFTHHFHYYYSNADEVKKALDTAQATGVKMIITCPELSTDTEETVRRFMNHPALAGYFTMDEPRDEHSIIEAGNLADRIRAIDQKHYCYLNLMPGGKTNTVSGIEYTVYLDWVRNHFNPEFVSFDNYSISRDKETSEVTIRPSWYDNFESISSFSKSLKKPFWAFAMSVAHSTPARWYVEPTIDHLRLQVYSALAYGAQAIQYFTYWTPLTDNTNLNDGEEHYFKGPITPDGKKTNIYDLVKTVNEEIKNLSFIFTSSNVIWVRHVGIRTQYEIIALDEELNSLPVKLFGENAGFLVALHEKGENQYLVFVNYLLTRNKLSIIAGKNVKRILKSGAMISAENEIYLKPGDAVVYSYINVKK